LRDTREPFDLLVVGGGATGLATALDGASRGHRVAVLERDDFAQGTSSRSTKLLHGGVRYLRQGRLSLVREALRERARLLRNAPHLAWRLDFILPATTWAAVLGYRAGLALYDALAGAARFSSARRLSAAEVRARLPGLAEGRLAGGVCYQDGQFDDAGLAVAFARTAAEHGAVVLNRVRVEGFVHAQGRVAGVRAVDGESGESLEIPARVVVNATGVEVDHLRRAEQPTAPALVTPSQGAHLVVGREFLPGDAALIAPRTDDGRVFFAIPWLGRVLLGTTDTPVERMETAPRPLAEEIDFLLRHAARYLARAPTATDVRSSYAGLRPLVRRGAAASTAQIGREHTLEVSPGGLLTVTGGKWTTCRAMAEQVVNRAEALGPLPPRPCRTADLPLVGHPAPGAAPDPEFPHFGDEAPLLRALLQEDPAYAEVLHPAWPWRRAEVVWHVRHGQARTVEDVLARRLRLLFLDAAQAAEAAEAVAALLGRELSWSGERVAAEAARFRVTAAGYRLTDSAHSS
jgi:glycerol-3-phosphate dehydrogenase